MRASVFRALLLAVAVLAARPAAAAQVTVYLFYGKACPACAEAERFLEGLGGRLPGLQVRAFEVTRHAGNAELMVEASRGLGAEAAAVPTVLVGGFEPLVGYGGDGTTGRVIEERVRACVERACPDPVAPVVAARLAAGGAAETAFPTRDATASLRPAVAAPAVEGTVDLPVLGPTEVGRLPLAVLAVVLGGLDGFNPCAFFVLFSLLGIMAHARSRGRMALVGGTFVFFSGLVYFLFMAAWLNLFLHLGALRIVTLAAGCTALAVGGINVKDYFIFGRGVSLSIPAGRKPHLFQRMRAILASASVPATLAGTAVLALAANSYELLCTAGFPMMFTRVLTLSGVGAAAHYRYLLLYNLVYVVPLLAVVAVFALTLGSRKLTERQGRALKLVSGLMMLGLGVVVLADPGLFTNPWAGAGLLAGALLAAAAITRLDGRRREAPGPPAQGTAAPGAGGGLRPAH